MRDWKRGHGSNIALHSCCRLWLVISHWALPLARRRRIRLLWRYKIASMKSRKLLQVGNQCHHRTASCLISKKEPRNHAKSFLDENWHFLPWRRKWKSWLENYIMKSSKIFIIILGHFFIYPLHAHFFWATRLSLTNMGWQFTLFLYIDIKQEASVSLSF